MRAAIFAVPLLLAGCYFQRDDSGDQSTFYDNGVVQVEDRSPTWKFAWGFKPIRMNKEPRMIAAATSATKGRIFDLAKVLDASTEQRLAAEIDAIQAARGHHLFVVTVPIGSDDSLEHFGWAVRSPSPLTRSMLFDAASRRVRIEGPQSPEIKAMVVRAMQPALARGQIDEALRIGIGRLGA